ncbi:hypothetical protein LTR56_018156 [Elasticomyces elasticus]|nr:hypothetical protein LTR56_018156 [Elasticomyces elasticus]KAK4912818.1 hypothetical protein LTR49_018780 [Elasticomyces elasticus]KAK5747328.1 hypothetical protein LTS12_022442 [Elasticomyces elasticus]
MARQSDQSECKLFALPPELRNAIYELAFTVHMEEPIELLSAIPPSNSFILTCRQIRDEAAGIYREACRSFWTTGHFVLTLDQDGKLVTASTIVHSATRDWEQMRNIVIIHENCTFHYMTEHGLWDCRSRVERLSFQSTFMSMAIPKKADATSISPNARLEFALYDTPGEAVLATGGHKAQMVNQIRTFIG